MAVLRRRGKPMGERHPLRGPMLNPEVAGGRYLGSGRSHRACPDRSWQWWRTSGCHPSGRPWCRQSRSGPRR